MDDYGLRTGQQAVDDYRRRHRINEPLLQTDWTGVYWWKSRTVPNSDVPQEGA